MRQIFILVSILLASVISRAQDSNKWLDSDTLLSLQNSSYNRIKTIFTGRNWSLDDRPSSQLRDYFGYNLDFEVNLWQNNTTNIFEGNVYLYFTDGIPNLIIYQAASSYFQKLLAGRRLNNNNPNYNSLRIRHPGGIVMEFRDYINITSNMRFSILIYNEVSVNNLIRIARIEQYVLNGERLYNQERYEDAKNQFINARDLLIPADTTVNNFVARINTGIDNCERWINIYTEFETGDSLYMQGSCIKALSHFEVAKNLLEPRDSSVLSNIDRYIQNCVECIEQLEFRRQINIAIQKGDSLFNIEKFSDAKIQYDTVSYFSKYLNPEDSALTRFLNSMIRKIEIEIYRLNINNILEHGDEFYTLGLEFESQFKYDIALFSYNEAFSKYDTARLTYDEARLKYVSNPQLIDNSIVSRVKIGTDSSEYRIQKMIDWQTIFSFNSLHPKEYNTFRDRNYDVLNGITNTFNFGNLNYKAIISFNNYGIDGNYIQINSSSNVKFNSYLNNISFSGITATQKLDYFIPSEDELDFNLTWNTERLIARSKKSKIKISLNNKEANYYIENFINQQKYKNGVYKFDATEKILNGEFFNEIKLTNYRNNAGPMKFLYSLFWPGIGTSKVTNGQRGGSKAAMFLFTGAISVGSKIYSDMQYDKYKNAKTVIEIEEYYKNADTANKVFLISGGLAATIYVYDIFWVFGKGIKNNNQSRELKSRLKKGPVYILNSPLKPK